MISWFCFFILSIFIFGIDYFCLKNIMKTSKSSFCTNLKIRSKVIRIISFIFIPSDSLKRIWVKKYLVKLSISFVALSQSKFWIVLWRIIKLLDNLLSLFILSMYVLFCFWVDLMTQSRYCKYCSFLNSLSIFIFVKVNWGVSVEFISSNLFNLGAEKF